MIPLRRLFVIACWATSLFVFVAAILPQRDAPHLGWSDKLDHMSAFFTICLLARIGYRQKPVALLLLSAALFGGLIELVQALPFIHRDAEWGDWIADIAASAIGLAVGWPIAILLSRQHRIPFEDSQN